MTKLCPRGKAAAKRKFKVYPSAYANAYASKICAGKIKDPSGVKRKDFKGKKPSGSKVASAAKKVRTRKKGVKMKIKKAGLGLMMALGKKERRRIGKQMKKSDLNMLSPGLYGMTQLEGGGIAEKPGSFLEINIDGDDSFTNPSTIAYYKDLLKGTR